MFTWLNKELEAKGLYTIGLKILANDMKYYTSFDFLLKYSLQTISIKYNTLNINIPKKMLFESW